MQLTLYKTLCIHTLMVMGIGGYFVEQRRAHAVMPPVRHVRMPTLDEQSQIAALGASVSFYQPGDFQSRNLALLDLMLRYMPPEHPDVVSTRQGLAMSFEMCDQYAEAAEQYRILLKIYQRVMGADAPETLQLQKDLNKMLELLRQSEWQKQRKIEFYKEKSLNLGQDDPLVMRMRENLIRDLMNEAKYDEAESELRALVEIQRRTKDDPGGWFAGNLTSLARCLKAQGKRPAALEVVQEIEWLAAETPDKDEGFSDAAAGLRAEINTPKVKRCAK